MPILAKTVALLFCFKSSVKCKEAKIEGLDLDLDYHYTEVLTMVII